MKRYILFIPLKKISDNMKTTFNFTILIALLFTVCSCEKEDVDGRYENGFETIKNDFYSRHSGASIEKRYAAGSTYWIEYTDKEGYFCKSVYDGGIFQLDMKMYTIDNVLEQLPAVVRNTFEGLGYSNVVAKVQRDNYRFAEITRRGINHKYYDFVFLENGAELSFSTSYVLIDEDGNLLRNNSLGNYQEFVTFKDDDVYKKIEEKYPGCDVRAFSYDGAAYQFLVVHEKKLITVTFENTGEDHFRLISSIVDKEDFSI